jgi:adenosine deaminase
MFDPQSHTSSGIEFATFMNGFIRAKQQAKNELGLSVELIMSFLRHLSEEDAIQVFHQAAPYYDHIIAVGLDSSELHHPPQKFARLFNMAREAGFKCVAHAGEEGPPDYIWGAIDTLKVDRIDHGVRAIEDAKLMAYLQDSALPLTVCPLSNVKLCVFNHMSKHTLLNMLDNGLMVTVNSDDPSYFGGYLNDNFVALHEHLNMSQHQLVRLIKNSFKASFLPETDKQYWLAKIDDWVR